MVNSPFADLVNQNGKKYAESIKKAQESNSYNDCKGCSLMDRNCPQKCKKPSRK